MLINLSFIYSDVPKNSSRGAVLGSQSQLVFDDFDSAAVAGVDELCEAGVL